jgi:NADPH:quinone reductase-like Zn-dependent oxidoreductase
MSATVLMIRARGRPDAPLSVAVETIDDSALPDGDVTIDVTHSSLNYKDALVLTGRPGLVRTPARPRHRPRRTRRRVARARRRRRQTTCS